MSKNVNNYLSLNTEISSFAIINYTLINSFYLNISRTLAENFQFSVYVGTHSVNSPLLNNINLYIFLLFDKTCFKNLLDSTWYNSLRGVPLSSKQINSSLHFACISLIAVGKLFARAPIISSLSTHAPKAR